jgi:hypothetical protein
MLGGSPPHCLPQLAQRSSEPSTLLSTLLQPACAAAMVCCASGQHMSARCIEAVSALLQYVIQPYQKTLLLM